MNKSLVHNQGVHLGPLVLAQALLAVAHLSCITNFRKDQLAPKVQVHAIVASINSQVTVTPKEPKTGALCCVAAGPHGPKSTAVSRDCSMDPIEPQWRTNSSFSPSSRRWDHRFQSEGLSQRLCDAPLYLSSLSSHSKDSRSGLNNDQHSNHHHSVSDGALSYIGSPSDTSQVIRWTPPPQKYDFGEFSTPSAGVRSEVSFSSRVSERNVMAGSSFYSPSQFPGSSRWSSSSKPPIFLPPRHFSGRRSFISKPVYPLVFQNPVSDAETAEGNNVDRLMLDDDSRNSPMWQGNMLSPEVKFHRALAELQKMEDSPDLNTSSRREGFRWSNASSYDFGYGADVIDITDHIGIENQRFPNNSLRSQKCGLCERLLWQKSPWSSHRMIRNTDMPVAGVLACQHVFHADCLEETTPKGQIHEPPCPVCLKTVSNERSTLKSEPLQVALRSLRRNQVANVATNVAGTSNTSHIEGDLRRSRTLPIPWKGGSLLKNRFKKRLSLKGRMGKDLFGTKMFRKARSSSSLPGIQSNNNPRDQ